MIKYLGHKNGEFNIMKKSEILNNSEGISYYEFL